MSAGILQFCGKLPGLLKCLKLVPRHHISLHLSVSIYLPVSFSWSACWSTFLDQFPNRIHPSLAPLMLISDSPGPLDLMPFSLIQEFSIYALSAYYPPGMDLVFGGRQDKISIRALGFPCFILSGKPFIYKQLKNKWANLSRWKELIQGHVVAQRILEKAKALGLKLLCQE